MPNARKPLISHLTAIVKGTLHPRASLAGRPPTHYRYYTYDQEHPLRADINLLGSVLTTCMLRKGFAAATRYKKRAEGLNEDGLPLLSHEFIIVTGRDIRNQKKWLKIVTKNTGVIDNALLAITAQDIEQVVDYTLNKRGITS